MRLKYVQVRKSRKVTLLAFTLMIRCIQAAEVEYLVQLLKVQGT